MSEKIDNSNALPSGTILFNTDSNVVTRANIDELLNQTGRISLDDAGNVCVIKAPAKRDNFLVAFFKGKILGTAAERAEYRSRERLYDNMEKVVKDSAFQASIAVALLKKRSESGSFIAADNLHYINEKLKAYMDKHTSGIDLIDLRNIASDVVEGANAQSIGAGMTEARLLCDYDKGSVPFNGRSQNVFSFIAAALPENMKLDDKLPFTPQGINESGLSYITQKLIGKCMIDPRDFDVLGLGREAQTINRVLNRGYPDIYDDKAILRKAVTGLLDAFKSYLADFATSALNKGKDPQQVAVALYGILKDTCDSVDYSRKSSYVLQKHFNPLKIEARIDQIANASDVAPTRAAGGDFSADEQPIIDDDVRFAMDLEKTFDCSPRDAMRTVAYFRARGIDAETYEKTRLLSDNLNFLNEISLALDRENSKGLDDAIACMENIFTRLNVRAEDSPRIIEMIAAQSVLEKTPDFIKNSIGSILSVLDKRIIAETGLQAKDLPENRACHEKNIANLKRMQSVFQEIENIWTAQGAIRDGDSYRDRAQLYTQHKLKRLDKDWTKLPDAVGQYTPTREAIPTETLNTIFDNYAAMGMMSSPAVTRYIEESLQQFPTECHEFARRYLTYMAKVRIGNDGGNIKQIKGYIDQIAAKLKDHDAVLNLVSAKKNTAVFNEVFARNLFFESDIGIFATIQSHAAEIDKTTGFHKNFDKDANRCTIRKIGDTELSSIAGDLRVQTARKQLMDMIPPPYLPFVTSVLEQGGMTSVMPYLLQTKNFRLKEGGPELNAAMINEQNHSFKFASYNDIAVDKATGKVTITCHNDIGLNPDSYAPYTGTDYPSPSKVPFARSFEFRLEFTIPQGEQAAADPGKILVPEDLEVTYLGENYDQPAPEHANEFIY